MEKLREQSQSDLKRTVAGFWDAASCGEAYMQGAGLRERLVAHATKRYMLEPYIFDFAKFPQAVDKDVLEIGVGLGADHLEWAKAKPRLLIGVDLTVRAVLYTKNRLTLFGHESHLHVADAENLPLKDHSVDIVYSWGVLHHSPDPAKAIAEIYRVLRPGGVVRAMIYQRHSITGWTLWMRYALLKGRPAITLNEIYFNHLESPGTKAYSIKEARCLFRSFPTFVASTRTSCSDLLEGVAGQRHKGAPLGFAKAVWPRWLIRRLCSDYGLFLLIDARK